MVDVRTACCLGTTAVGRFDVRELALRSFTRDGSRPEVIPDGHAETSRRLCDRHFGIGADGVLTILPEPGASPR